VNTKRFSIVLGIAVLALATIGSLYWKASHLGSNSASSVIAFERTFLPAASASLVNSFEVPGNIGKLYSYGDKIYGYNFSQATLHEMNAAGAILKTIGKRGQGPGEFEHIDDIDIDSTGFYFLDTDQLRVTVFDSRGTFKNLQPFATSIRRGIRLRGASYLVRETSENSTSSETEEFTILHTNAKHPERTSVKRLEKSLSQNPSINDMEIDGAFLRSTTGKIFRPSFHAGQFQAFDSAGKPLFRVHTIDKSPLPRMSQEKAGDNVITAYSPETRTICYDAAADEKFLFILSNAAHPDLVELKQGTNKDVIIDAYNVSNGLYRFSIKLPPLDLSNPKLNVPKSIVCTKNGFFLLCGAYVHQYSFVIPSL
jgi:hypothetical protein